MLKVKHFRQTPGLCGPYSLKILLSFFGKDEGIKKLIRSCKATSKHGAEHGDLVKTAKKMGAVVWSKSWSTLNDIDNWVNRKKLPVIVGWFSEDSDHYAVVIGADKKFVYMCDPQEDKPMIKINKKFFNDIWFQFAGKKNEKIVWRWMMVITKI